MQTVEANYLLLAFAVTTFVAVLFLAEGLYMLWNTYMGPQARQIEQRLRTISAGADGSRQSQLLKRRMLSDVPKLERFLLSVPRIHHLDRFVVQSGLNWTVTRLVLLALLFGMVAYAALSSYAAWLHGALRLAMAVAIALLPAAYVQYKRNARLDKIERQLPDALDLIGRALRAGHSFPSGLKMVSEELSGPIASEFGATHDEVNYGVTLQQALINLGQRVPVTDLRYFVVAVLIQRETGGNLTELLTNLSRLIRSRLQLQAKVKVLTAESRLSAWTLGLMPFILAALLNMGNPEFIRVLWTDPAGIKLTQTMLLVMALGALWLWRLTKVRV